MTDLPMFPLGSVLFPYMPLPLRVFEERYLVMLSRILEAEPAEFGVVLIERGQEVGGGEHRFTFGTVAQITQIDANEQFVVLVAQGERRIEVVEWQSEDPYPLATVRDVPALEWRDDLQPLRQRAEDTVRRALTLSAKFDDEQLWSPEVELSDDPLAAAWQLAAITPIGLIDQIALLRSTTMEILLEAILEYATSVEQAFNIVWPDEKP